MGIDFVFSVSPKGVDFHLLLIAAMGTSVGSMTGHVSRFVWTVATLRQATVRA